ncbi:MAG: thioredoxin domain-containing protein [Planctomycetota bacterium]
MAQIKLMAWKTPLAFLLLFGQLCFGQQAGPSKPRQEESTVHRHTNALIKETSPYLLQHAHNPVNWLPWGAAALKKAKAENKPIFVSVGYSTCYWCHVMERESFEKEDVAEILNEHYVCIKVDREERPEVDQQYMMATQLLTGRGGWPNSVWLTPDGRPWMAGTYFPREQFKKALLYLSGVWKNRQAEIETQADNVTAAIKSAGNAKVEPRPIAQGLIDAAIQASADRFDATHGGFGSKPKFPPHATLEVLIDQARRGDDSHVKEMIEKTLVQMARGGVYDHLGGGFHRYSTDERWLLPHFEKMLYDNGQLMKAYTDGYLLSGNEAHLQTIEGIYQWVNREMTSPEGGFYSAVDSESDAEEGKFYVWAYTEVLKVLGETDGKRFCDVYGIKPEGNFKEEATGHPSPNNVLHLAAAISKSDWASLDVMRGKLRDVRAKREYPHLDDKVLAAWNGLMIEGLAYAGRHLKEERYVRAAERAGEFLIEKMLTDGELKRTYRAGTAKLSGYLNDYAFCAAAFLELHLATGKQTYLDTSKLLTTSALAQFQDTDGGGFYFTATPNDAGEEFVIRSKNLAGGGNLPSGNGVLARVLFALDSTEANDEYADAARGTLDGLSGFLWQSAGQSDQLLVAAATQLERESASSTEGGFKFVAPGIKGAVILPAEKVTAGQVFEATVRLNIKTGYHLYAAKTKFGSPTTLTLQKNQAIELVSLAKPESKRLVDTVFNQELDVLEGEVSFVLRLKLADRVRADSRVPFKLTIASQACDATKCLPPSETQVQCELVVAQ